jgi:hypothetical protein
LSLLCLNVANALLSFLTRIRRQIGHRRLSNTECPNLRDGYLVFIQSESRRVNDARQHSASLLQFNPRHHPREPSNWGKTRGSEVRRHNRSVPEAAGVATFARTSLQRRDRWRGAFVALCLCARITARRSVGCWVAPSNHSIRKIRHQIDFLSRLPAFQIHQSMSFLAHAPAISVASKPFPPSPPKSAKNFPWPPSNSVCPANGVPSAPCRDTPSPRALRGTW